MRTMLKSVLVALVAVLALGTAIAATASATELKWEVKEGETWKTLETGSRKITIKQQGTQVFSFPYSYHAEIRCEKIKVTGAIYPGGNGDFEELKYIGCKVVLLNNKETCGWVSSPAQPNGTILMAPSLPGVLVAKEGAIYYEVKENPSLKEFVHINIHHEGVEEEIKCGVISKGWQTLKGSFLGKMNNATSELEFVGEGTLNLETVPLQYFGNDLIEVEGGGAIRAN